MRYVFTQSDVSIISLAGSHPHGAFLESKFLMELEELWNVIRFLCIFFWSSVQSVDKSAVFHQAFSVYN